MNKKFRSIFMVVACIIILSVSISQPSLAATSTKALNLTSPYLVKGETTSLKVGGISKKATWTSTNNQIATVSSSGKVTAVAYGTATIKATVNKTTYKCYITVIDPSLIKITPSSTEVVVNGDAVSLNPTSYIYSASAVKKMGITYKISGNAGVTVSSIGEVKATEAGSFTIAAFVHGKKIETVSMKAVTFTGFTEPSVSIIPTGTKYITFADDYTPVLDGVKATSSDNSIATVSLTPVVTMESDVDHCDGIEIRGIKDGTVTITITYAGIAKEIQVIVGAGVAILAPVDAVKNNDYTGYKGEALTTLKWIRDFIDTNNLLSTTMSDREKITIIQTHLNKTAKSSTGDTLYNGVISRVLFDGDGLCAAYAETFSMLCECIGVEVYYCYGTGLDSETGKWISHAWNKVRIDDIWYYIDPTWCSDLNNLKRYFLSETLWSDHRLSREDTYTNIYKNPGFAIYSNGFY